VAIARATAAPPAGRWPPSSPTSSAFLIDIDDPVVDFVSLKPAFERAKREVVEHGRVALVDLYTQVARVAQITRLWG